MTSANDTPGGDFDERLGQAIDAALMDGEQLVAQETGDQGQAIALTKSRILVVKAGFAATGELDGHKVSEFDLEQVTSVNLRKGPLGAVIQICAESSAATAQSGPPDNVIVFTGPGRVKRAEAFVAQVEFLSGKPVNRIDPSPRPEPPAVQAQETQAPADAVPEAAAPEAQSAEAQAATAAEPEAPAKPKGGRIPRSLAEEIYGEVLEAQKNPAKDVPTPAEASQPPVESAPTMTAPEPVVIEDEVEEEPEPSSQYRPNPRLPKPTRKQKSGPNGVLVLLGVTASLVLIGMAIMAPVRQDQKDTTAVVDLTGAAGAKAIRSQLVTVQKYRGQIAPLLAKAEAEAATMKNAARSGNKAAAKSVGEAANTDAALDSVSGLVPPPGLAESQGDLTSGLLAQKTAIASAAAAAQTGSLPAQETVKRLDEASAQIRQGMSAIARAQSQLEKQAAGPAASKRK